MGVIAEGILRGCQDLFTPVSLGYPLSVFNKNSTLERRKNERRARVNSSGVLCFISGVALRDFQTENEVDTPF